MVTTFPFWSLQNRREHRWHEDGRALSCGFDLNWFDPIGVLFTFTGVLTARHLRMG